MAGYFPVFVGSVLEGDLLDEGSPCIGFHGQVAHNRRTGDTDQSLKPPNISLIMTQQHKIKRKILNNNIKITLNLKLIPHISLTLLPMKNSNLTRKLNKLHDLGVHVNLYLKQQLLLIILVYPGTHLP